MLTLFSIAILINVGGILVGSFLTENKTLALAKWSKRFDTKPFNCRPCLTFHLLWITYAIVSIVVGSWMLFGMGLLFSLAIFGVLYLENKFKITE